MLGLDVLPLCLLSVSLALSDGGPQWPRPPLASARLAWMDRWKDDRPHHHLAGASHLGVSAAKKLGRSSATVPSVPRSWMEQQAGGEGAMVAASSVSRMARRAPAAHRPHEKNTHTHTLFYPHTHASTAGPSAHTISEICVLGRRGTK